MKVLHAFVLTVFAVMSRAVAPVAAGEYQAKEVVPDAARSFADIEELFTDEMMKGNDFYLCGPDVIPAWLLKARTEKVTFFQGLEELGRSTPQYLAYPSKNGVKIARRGASIKPEEISEPWVLAWWGDAWGQARYGQPTWWGKHPSRTLEAFDAPVVVVLGRRPASVRLDGSGLTFSYKGQAGYVAFMPLYGAGRVWAKKIASWSGALPGDIVEKCRFWSRALKNFPVNCNEHYSIDGRNDVVSVRQSFDYLVWKDDWKTRPVRIAPINPILGLCFTKGFPITFSSRPAEEKIPTYCGYFRYIPGRGSYTYRIKGIMKYVNEIAAAPEEAERSQAARDARAELVKRFGKGRMFEWNWTGYTRGVSLAVWHNARCIPFLAPDVQKKVGEQLKEALLATPLNPTNYYPFRSYPEGIRNNYLADKECGHALDSSKIPQAVPIGVWAYGHYTGDWKTVEEGWPIVSKIFHLPVQTTWLTQCPQNWAVQDLHIGAIEGTIGFARIAHRLGRTEQYNYACYLLAKNLAALFAAQKGIEYMRENEPWFVNVGTDTFVQSLNGVMGFALSPHSVIDNQNVKEGWQEGRGWTEVYGWMDVDIYRFYKDHLMDIAADSFRRILPKYLPKWAKAGLPIQARIYLFDEPAEKAWNYMAEDKEMMKIYRGRISYLIAKSSPIASIAALAEDGGKLHTRRIIEPAAAPTPFVPGNQREVRRGGGMNAVAANISTVGGRWPTPYWFGISHAGMKSLPLADFTRTNIPLGGIAPGPEAKRGFTRSAAPNWVCGIWTENAYNVTEVASERASDKAAVVRWRTPRPATSQVCYWVHDPKKRPKGTFTPPSKTMTTAHRVRIAGLDAAAGYDHMVISVTADGRKFLSAPRPMAGYMNLAEGKVVKVYGGDGAAALLDGRADRNRKWSGYSGDKRWLIVDLGAEYLVDKVVMYHFMRDKRRVSKEYRFDTGGDMTSGNNDAAWSRVLLHVKDNKAAVAVHKFTPTKLRYLRVRFYRSRQTDKVQSFTFLHEIEVWGRE